MREPGLKVTQLMRGDDPEACLLGSSQGINDNTCGQARRTGPGLQRVLGTCSSFSFLLHASFRLHRPGRIERECLFSQRSFDFVL